MGEQGCGIHTLTNLGGWTEVPAEQVPSRISCKQYLRKTHQEGGFTTRVEKSSSQLLPSFGAVGNEHMHHTFWKLELIMHNACACPACHWRPNIAEQILLLRKSHNIRLAPKLVNCKFWVHTKRISTESPKAYKFRLLLRSLCETDQCRQTS